MAETLGLQGTPTSFIGNTRVEGAVPVTILQDEAEKAGATQ
jgi:protein-disulfide isomerase